MIFNKENRHGSDSVRRRNFHDDDRKRTFVQSRSLSLVDDEDIIFHEILLAFQLYRFNRDVRTEL